MCIYILSSRQTLPSCLAGTVAMTTVMTVSVATALWKWTSIQYHLRLLGCVLQSQNWVWEDAGNGFPSLCLPGAALCPWALWARQSAALLCSWVLGAGSQGWTVQTTSGAFGWNQLWLPLSIYYLTAWGFAGSCKEIICLKPVAWSLAFKSAFSYLFKYPDIKKRCSHQNSILMKVIFFPTTSTQHLPQWSLSLGLKKCSRCRYRL